MRVKIKLTVLPVIPATLQTRQTVIKCVTCLKCSYWGYEECTQGGNGEDTSLPTQWTELWHWWASLTIWVCFIYTKMNFANEHCISSKKNKPYMQHTIFFDLEKMCDMLILWTDGQRMYKQLYKLWFVSLSCQKAWIRFILHQFFKSLMWKSASHN